MNIYTLCSSQSKTPHIPYWSSQIEVLSMKMAAETLPDEHHLHFHSPAWAILPSHHS